MMNIAHAYLESKDLKDNTSAESQPEELKRSEAW